MKIYSERHIPVMTAYLDDLEAKQQPLPGFGGRINFSRLARDTGLPTSCFVNSHPVRVLVEGRAKYLGILEASGPTRVKAQPENIVYKRLTYSDLKFRSEAYFVRNNISSSSVPSYISALNKWMKYFELSEEGFTSTHLEEFFEIHLASFGSNEQDSVISRLRFWSKTGRELAREDQSLPEKFSDALNLLIERSGYSRNALSKELRVVHSTLNKWDNCASVPEDRTTVTDLEILLKVPPGTLSNRTAPHSKSRIERFRKIPDDWWPESWRKKPGKQNQPFYKKRKLILKRIPASAFLEGGSVLRLEFTSAFEYIERGDHTTKYRKRHPMFKQKAYGYPFEAWNDLLKDEWSKLCDYKTKEPGFRNSERNGKWNPASSSKSASDLVYFFGFLLLADNNEDSMLKGKGLLPEQMTLAWLTVSSIVNEYLDFRNIRSGAFNASTKNFITIFMALLRPSSGWLWQHPELLIRLPESEQIKIEKSGGWQVNCQKTRDSLNKTLKGFEKDDMIIFSRDPFEAILPILEMDNPVKAIVKALKFHKRDLDIMQKNQKLVIATIAAEWRNYVLISLLIRLPLRAKHWSLLTYSPKDNRGKLRRNERGWELALPYSEFKNYANRNIFERRGDGLLVIDFSNPKYALLDQLSSLLDEYTTKYWPILAKDGSFLFPKFDGGKQSVYNISECICRWTTEYLSEQSNRGYGIPGVLPFRTHAFRDIVATSLIKTASITEAAAALLDSPKTVEEHYTRFLPGDRLKQAFAAHEKSFRDDDDREST